MSLHSVDDCDAWVNAIYGDTFVAREQHCLSHVTALWKDPGEPTSDYTTLRINDHTPRSRNDRIALGLARARAEVIVTTGRILRDEQALTHRYLDDDVGHSALGAWRSERLGWDAPPQILFLTSGRDLSFDHPAFHAGHQIVVFTGAEAAVRLSGQTRPRSVAVQGSKSPSLGAALRYLREERGVRAISIEAGPTTTRALYDPPLVVEELMLSLFLGPTLPDSVRGPVFAPGVAWREAMVCHSKTRVEEPSGPWSFARYIARSPR